MSEISPLVRLVDDDDAFRESQKLFLSMCGYEVRDWADPVRFLEEDDPRVPGCLVLDIRMPEMTGLELQRALYVRGNKLPIIFFLSFIEESQIISREPLSTRGSLIF